MNYKNRSSLILLEDSSSLIVTNSNFSKFFFSYGIVTTMSLHTEIWITNCQFENYNPYGFIDFTNQPLTPAAILSSTSHLTSITSSTFDNFTLDDSHTMFAQISNTASSFLAQNLTFRNLDIQGLVFLFSRAGTITLKNLWVQDSGFDSGIFFSAGYSLTISLNNLTFENLSLNQNSVLFNHTWNSLVGFNGITGR